MKFRKDISGSIAMTNTESRTASTAHTPGPWSACREGYCSCGYVYGDLGNVWVAKAYGEAELANLEADCVPTSAMQQANARLIAAAPDMLAALKFALLSLEYIDKQHSEITGTFQRVTAIGLAREAIAKATGAVGDRTHDATPQTVA